VDQIESLYNQRPLAPFDYVSLSLFTYHCYCSPEEMPPKTPNLPYSPVWSLWTMKGILSLSPSSIGSGAGAGPSPPLWAGLLNSFLLPLSTVTLSNTPCVCTTKVKASSWLKLKSLSLLALSIVARVPRQPCVCSEQQL